jgi:hypothetical protein
MSRFCCPSAFGFFAPIVAGRKVSRRKLVSRSLAFRIPLRRPCRKVRTKNTPATSHQLTPVRYLARDLRPITCSDADANLAAGAEAGDFYPPTLPVISTSLTSRSRRVRWYLCAAAVADAMTMKTAKSTVMPWPDLADDFADAIFHSPGRRMIQSEINPPCADRWLCSCDDSMRRHSLNSALAISRGLDKSMLYSLSTWPRPGDITTTRSPGRSFRRWYA